ncbi:sulfite exporter TauE/SafE family protein [Nocardiopsis sp. NPDC006938]|uniref:sulfite exporter TauE/SafE family protein n=1 Tax=Nocardiopsis sp. NPDC006938 TaxID=3364337 RepID=UPI00367B3A7A
MILLLAALAGLCVAALTTPVGVSGAVLLLPVQIGVLGLHGPAVSATNLLYNVVSTPFGLGRLARSAHGAGIGPLVAAGAAVPCAVAGAAVRVTWLADPALFRGLLAVLMLGMGARLLVTRARPRPGTGSPGHRHGGGLPLAAAAGTCALLGAAVGIGGGSLLAPLLIVAGGWAASRAAVAGLTTTLVTSVVGLCAYAVFDRIGFGAAPAAPDWGVGVAMGAGGALGALVGAALGRRLGERRLRLLLGVLVTAAGAATLAGLATG